MVKKLSGFVLTSLKPSTYLEPYASDFRSLWPCSRNGASWRAGVGRVRRMVFDHPAMQQW